jgi:hypothetical protein
MSVRKTDKQAPSYLAGAAAMRANDTSVSFRIGFLIGDASANFDLVRVKHVLGTAARNGSHAILMRKPIYWRWLPPQSNPSTRLAPNHLRKETIFGRIRLVSLDLSRLSQVLLIFAPNMSDGQI